MEPTTSETSPKRECPKVIQRRLVQRLIDLLTDPSQKWRFDTYTADHPSGMRIWVASIPIFDINTSPVKNSFTLWDKYLIWKAVKVARNHWSLRILAKTDQRPPT